MRKSDKGEKKHFRFPDRVFRRKREWYFRAREGDRGPFSTREAATLAFEQFVDTMKYVDANKKSLPSDVDYGDVTMVEVQKPRNFAR